MKFISIDCETTGLDPETNDILQIGAVIEDTATRLPLDQLPKFNYFLWRSRYTGSAYALNLNKWMFQELAAYEARQRYPYQVEKIGFGTTTEDNASFQNLSSYIGPWWEAPNVFYNWLKDNGFSPPENGKKITLNVAGKNFATFDKRFLEKLEAWNKLFKVRQRIIDPAILFVDWNEDEALPGLDKCKQRVGLNSVVTHDAVDDALDVIRVLRAEY